MGTICATLWYCDAVNTADAIYEKAKALPDQRQVEALHYVNFLLSQERAKGESAAWAALSAAQLAKQYAPEDDVYDQD